MSSAPPQAPSLATERALKRTSLLRRFGGGALILIVAAGLWWVTAQQRAAQAGEIRDWVQRLCADLAAGGAASAIPAGRFALPVLEQRCLAEIREVLGASPRAIEGLTIDVSPGDDETHGDGSATHIARISAGGSFRLGLRISHPGRRGEFQIIGLWTPEPPRDQPAPTP